MYFRRDLGNGAVVNRARRAEAQVRKRLFGLNLLTFSRRLTARNESLRDWAFHPAAVCTSARKLLQLCERGKTI